jgi:hypothetical protein
MSVYSDMMSAAQPRARVISMAGFLAILMAVTLATGAAPEQPSTDAVTLCEDGGGVGWWRPAKDLLDTVQKQIAEFGEIRLPTPPEGTTAPATTSVRPPIRVSNVRFTGQIERVSRLCATFSANRRQRAARPTPTRWLVREHLTYCQLSGDQSWESGFTKILEASANDGLLRTLEENEAVLILDTTTRTFSQGMARRGDTVRVGGRYITDIELLPNDNGPPSVCVSFAN